MSRPPGLNSTFSSSLNASKSFKPPQRTNGSSHADHADAQVVNNSSSGGLRKKPRLSITPAAAASPAAASKSNASTGLALIRPNASGGSGVKAVYMAMYRTPTNKKRKTWEADGIVVQMINNALHLKNLESGKEVTRGTTRTEDLQAEEIYNIGGKEVEIGAPVSIQHYLSGAVFNGSPVPAAAAPQASTSAVTLDHVVSSSSSSQTPTSKPFKDPVFGGSPSKTPAATATKATPRFDPTVPGAIVMKRPSAAHQKRFNDKGLPVVDVVVDPCIGKKLRPHQIEGVKFLYEAVMGMSESESASRAPGQGAILADDMGLGKSIQAIALVWTLLRQNPYFGTNHTAVRRVLIVCPASLIHNWRKEFDKWLGPDKIKAFVLDGSKTTDPKTLCASNYHEVIIMGYERLRIDADVLAKATPPMGLVICDEGHRLKTAESKTVQALEKIKTPKRIILSGTPIQNDLSEFHAVADWVNPGVFQDYPKFKRTYEVPILRSRDQRCTRDNRELGAQRNEELMRKSKLFVLRRTAEILQGYLPPKHEHVVFIQPTGVQRSLCQRVISNHYARMQESQTLQTLMMLQKVCNSPGLLILRMQKGKDTPLLQGAEDLLEGESAADPDLSGKLKVLVDLLAILHKETDEKIVIASNFTHTLDLVQEICQANKYTVCRLDGATQVKERQRIVDTFNRVSQRQQFVFLLSSKAGGTGLNITGASRLVLLDSDWNPSVDLQAMARIHRDGQTKPVHLYRFLTAGCIDEKIFQRQITKNGLANALMDNPTDVAGQSKTDAFTQAELKALLRIHDGTQCETHDLLGCRCLMDGPESSTPAADLGDDPWDMPPPTFSSAKDFKDEPNPFKQGRLDVLQSWQHVNGYDENSIEELADRCLFKVAREGAEMCAKLTAGAVTSSLAEDTIIDPRLALDDEDEDPLTPEPNQIPFWNLSATISFVLSKTTEAVKQYTEVKSGDDG